MATIISLNKDFFDAIETALGCKEENGRWVKKETNNNNADVEESKLKLIDIYVHSREEIKALTKDYNEAVSPIRGLLNKGGKLSEDQQNTAKENFKQHQDEFKQRLQTIHRELYNEFDLALEDGFALKERFSILAQLKDAQREQLEELQRHAEMDQERLKNPPDIDRRRDQMFSARMILGTVEENQAMGEYYRPFRIRAELGQVEVDQIAEFSSDNLEQKQEAGSSTKRWKLKKKGEAGGQPAEIDEEWLSMTTNYLAGREQLEINSLPSGGVFNIPRLGREPLIIELNAQVEENKEKGIPAASGVVCCKIPARATPEQTAVLLNALAHSYMAKGWRGVELGYQTESKLWKEAYLACRRAGFRHDQIFFKGQPMNDQELELRGDLARKKLVDAYKEKEAQEKNGRPDEPTITRAMEKLAGFVYSDLNKDTFFASKDDDRLTVFESGSLKQQATILADYAFDTVALPDYIGKLTSGELATILEEIVNHNPDRLLAVFEKIGANEDPLEKVEKQQKVFNALHPEAAACLLKQLPKETATEVFKNFSKPLTPESQERKFQILANPNLSDSMVYELYESLSKDKTNNEEYTEQQQALNYLAEKPIDNQKVLGAIVAQQFMNMPENTPEARKNQAEAVFKTLNDILRQVPSKPEGGAQSVMQGVYNALPTHKLYNNPWASEVAKFETMVKNATQPDILRLLERVKKAPNAPVTYSDKIVIETLESSYLEKLYYKNENVQQTARLLSQLIQENSQNRNIISKIINQADRPEKQSRVVEILKALGPTVMVDQLIALGDQATFNFVFERWKKEPEFLANILSVMYAKSADTGLHLWKKYYDSIKSKAEVYEFNDNDLFGNNYKDLANIKLLTRLVPYINHPKLINHIIKDEEAGKIAAIISDLPDKTQQAKIINSLATNSKLQLAVYKQLDEKQKSTLFVYLNEKNQSNYIQELLRESIPRESKVKRADHIIACWNNSHVSGKYHHNFNQLLSGNAYALVVDNASRSSAQFLKQFFSMLPEQQLNNTFKDVMDLNQRFQGIQARDQQEIAKENYLANVGQAIAELDKPKQKALFVEELNKINSPEDVVTVRAHALIDLLSKGDKETAKALFTDQGLNQQAKDDLKKKVIELGEGIPGSFQQNLHAWVEKQEAKPAPAQNGPPVPQ